MKHALVPVKRCDCGHPWSYHSPRGCLFIVRRDAHFYDGVFYITHVEFCGCQRRPI